MATIDEAPELHTVGEVARKPRLSGATVRRLVHSGEIPALRVGGSIRIRRDDLDALLERPAEHATHEESP
jgi:excisionase family DNA binding protein